MGRWPQLYYAATLGFAALDLFAGANVRAVGFDAWPALRGVYYGLCLGLFVTVRLRPAWGPPLALAESAVNLTSLVLAVLAPYYALAGAIDAHSGPLGSPLTPAFLINFAIAGSVAWLGFRQSERALRASSGRGDAWVSPLPRRGDGRSDPDRA